MNVEYGNSVIGSIVIFFMTINITIYIICTAFVQYNQ